MRGRLGGALGKKTRWTTDTPSQLPSQCPPGQPRPPGPSPPLSTFPQGSFPIHPYRFATAATGQGTCQFILQPSPWQQPWESCPLPRTAISCPCALQAPAGSPTEGEALRAGWGGDTALCCWGPEDVWAAARKRPLHAILVLPVDWALLGCSRAPPTSRARLPLSLVPAGPALLLGLPRPPSGAALGQGLPANPTAAPPQLSSGLAPLPSPNCRSSCHRQLSPRLHSKCSPPTVLPKRHCQLPAPSFLSPSSHHHPQAWHHSSAFQAVPPGQRLGHTRHVPGRGRGQRQKAGEGAGG